MNSRWKIRYTKEYKKYDRNTIYCEKIVLKKEKEIKDWW